MRWNSTEIAISVFFSFVVVTILNMLVHMMFPQIGILKTGFALVLILIGILLVMLFTYAKDGFSKDEIWALLIIVAVMVGIYLIVKHFVPALFSVLPERLKEVFSILP